MTFRFIHAGDLHLGYPFSRIKGISRSEANRMRREHFAAFDRLVKGILRADVDFLLIAGDTFDRNFHCEESRIRFLKAMERMESEGLRVLIVAGNHDPLSEWEIAPLLPSNVRLFGDRAETEEISVNGIPVATVAGASHKDRMVVSNLAAEVAMALEGSPFFRVGLVHANVGTVAYAAPVTLEELENSRVGYWALGHMHRQKLLCKRPYALYCGSIYRLCREENDRYGINLVTVSDGVPSLELLPF